MSSWRAFVAEPYWLMHDATISHEGGPRSTRYEVHVGGRLVASRPSLEDAKAFVEKDYGPQSWYTVRVPKVEVEHYHFGPSTEWTSPTTIWAADFSL